MFIPGRTAVGTKRTHDKHSPVSRDSDVETQTEYSLCFEILCEGTLDKRSGAGCHSVTIPATAMLFLTIKKFISTYD